MISYPPDLPITQRREEILNALRAHPVVIIAGETGSGKTTQIPKLCLEAGLARTGRIGCTQPRRVAALSISRRVAEELGVPWGREVGCKMRFQDHTSRQTVVKFMTDGILLAEIQSDPQLRAYSTLILDEAHERSLNIDFLIGHLRNLLVTRKDLHLVITSATIDTGAFSEAFGGAPVIEVSGRLYPVETRYAPTTSFARPSEDPAELTHIEAAVRATEDALIESHDGDVLVFMPTERDIQETRDLLQSSLGSGIEILTLFSRMPANDQLRIFSPESKRRVIVATNIAETSLTLPRIRYVIDSGLARLSRYNPRTRTKRLPVEPVSQSSANQRAGRAGRIQNGICIRLYSEEEFQARPRFTTPEIQRANLAEVILRMKAFRLGEIERFPFLNPPTAAATRAGYKLLQELGALSDSNELTDTGHQLARLPIDPVPGRMLLEAQSENVLPEILVIASALSLPDPRERPEEAKDAATTAHKAFAHPDSDFLTLLNIWNAVPGDRSAVNSLRRFCKKNFLSFTRMREWRDLHRQLSEAFPAASQSSSQKPQAAPPADSIHRAILSGLLGQVALKTERNTFKATGDRAVTLFPGSHLYQRKDTKKPAAKAPESKQPPKNNPGTQWIMAAELVETSQLFARTVAWIQPEWILSLGKHLCQIRHHDPHWSQKAGRVLVTERALLSGLEVGRRQIDFGSVDPVQATELFIRGALVQDEIRAPLPFLSKNRELRQKIETAMTRIRHQRAVDLDQAFYLYYARHLTAVSSVHDLQRVVRERSDLGFLCATESDILGQQEAEFDAALFPDQVPIQNAVLPVSYAYSPGTETDGVTLQVPLPLVRTLTTGQTHWLVPGLREELALALLRALPKSIRKNLLPLEPKARDIADRFQPDPGCFLTHLARFISRTYQIHVQTEDWPPNALPAHLLPRIEVVDARAKTLATGRNLDDLKTQLDSSNHSSSAWEKTAGKWERSSVTRWNFGDLPESIPVEAIGTVAVLAYPGLTLEEQSVAVRLFRSPEEAQSASARGLKHLANLQLTKERDWLRKELRSLNTPHNPTAKPANPFNALSQVRLPQKPISPQTATGVDPAALGADVILDHLLTISPIFPLTLARFDALLADTKRQIPLFASQLLQRLRELQALQQTLVTSTHRYPGMEQDLQRIFPSDFPGKIPWPQIAHLPRYLKAIQIRAQRASLQPAKDAEKAKQLAPFADWEKKVAAPKKEEFRWALEEFRVSVFAQELGTAQPISAQRLRALGGF
jgi:ATP-dependent helicase HrpA